MQEPTCMWAPASSSARKEASSPVRRSGLAIAAIVHHLTPATNFQQLRIQTFNTVYNVVMAMDLADPQTFRQVFEQHERGVHAAALRILGNPAQAQDVVQDVFLRVWRRPATFDANRGELGSYLRLMARSRALDLWREGQAAGRASDRLKVVVGGAEPRVEEQPASAIERDDARASVRDALRRLPEPQREALVLASWGGLPAAQLARREQVPLGTAKSRIRLGLAKLRQEFPALALEAA